MVIPPHVLKRAKGLAIITQLKAGFLFSGRAGSGVIVARLDDGSWSAPSAIITAGAGVGGQIGAELTDFVFILNTKAAVDTFSQAGSITLGGNVSVAVGPLGRNAEAAGSASLGSVAAIFAYSKTKGLFAGVSLEGSMLVERRDANRKFYGPGCTAKKILSGHVEAPPECDILFRVLDSRAFSIRQSDDWNDDDDYYNGGNRRGDSLYDDIPDDFSDSPSYQDESRSHYDYYDRDRTRGRPLDKDYSSGRRRSNSDGSRSHFTSTYSDNLDGSKHSSGRGDPYRPSMSKPNFSRSTTGTSNRPRSHSDAPAQYDRERLQEKQREEERRLEASQQGSKAVALYTFSAERSGDLAFRKGDIITIVRRTDTQDDWWTGRKAGVEGIFPANYVEIV